MAYLRYLFSDSLYHRRYILADRRKTNLIYGRIELLLANKEARWVHTSCEQDGMYCYFYFVGVSDLKDA